MTPPIAAPPLLSIRGLSKSFPGLRALSDVDLDVSGGEIVAVVGQNGSGKSTLVKVLTGIHEPDPDSEITVRQADGTRSSDRAGIHVIHQDLGLIPTLSTVENLDLGTPLGRRALRTTPGRREQEHAHRLVARFGATFDVRARVETLTPAERAIVAIARALDSWERPDQILLLDEPTAALHGNEAARLFTAVRRVASEGAGVVFISHRLDEVLNIADRVVALRGGQLVANVSTSSLDREALIELIAGRAVSEAPDLSGREVGDGVLRLRGVSGAGVRSTDLDVPAGQVLGISGILGSGREHLAGLVFGAAPRRGDVLVGGKRLRPGSPRDAVALGVGFVPANRSADGAVLGMSARENLTLPGLGALRGRLGSFNSKAERRSAQEWCRRIELDPRQPERVLELFSGGNQQKIVLAKWLRNEPALLLLDEPTQGVDVGAKAAIYDLILTAAAKGAAVLVSSSDTAELALLCDRVVVFRDGAITADLERSVVSEARLVAENLGHEVRTDVLLGTGASR